MIETYSHTRIEAKYEAVKALDKIGPTAPAQVSQPPTSAELESEVRTSMPQRQIPNIEHPSIQAEIDRRVALALEARRGTSRTSERPLRRGLIRRRRSANREHQGPIRHPSAPNVLSFPSPRPA